MAKKYQTVHGVLSLTDHVKDGKMDGFRSLNTSVACNKFCQAMRKSKNSVICKSCFASNMEKRYKSLKENNIQNGKILSENLFSVDEMPKLNELAFRIHSNGELINDTHFKNILALCKANPNTIVTLWTKRTNIVYRVLLVEEKPANLILIYSSKMINVEENLPIHFDKTFTVYSKDQADKVIINCGGKKCRDCMLCYSHNKVTKIKELIK